MNTTLHWWKFTLFYYSSNFFTLTSFASGLWFVLFKIKLLIMRPLGFSERLLPIAQSSQPFIASNPHSSSEPSMDSIRRSLDGFHRCIVQVRYIYISELILMDFK
jgi:hypothetical protein